MASLLRSPTLFAVMLVSLAAIGCAPDGSSRTDTLQSVDRQGAAGTSEGSSDRAQQAAATGPSNDEPGDESACLGRLTPPRGAGGASYIQETVFSSTDGIEQVKQTARTELRDRLCQGILCSMIDQNINIWKSEEDGGYRCVMAVIKKAHLDEWVARVETQLGERLADRAGVVVERFKEDLGRPPRVAIAKIPDQGIPGGPRSEWLYGNLQYALEQASAEVVPLQPNWSGQGIPHKVDGVVLATISDLGGAEAMMEVRWKIKSADRVFSAEAVSFPQVVAPDVNDATFLPALNIGSDKVSIHFDAREGGGLCNGQNTELWLETTEDLYVRVINLYGKVGGLVIFPVQEGDDDLVEAGQPVSLGKFDAMKTGEIGVERFLVLASPTREGLGKFAAADHFCRLMPTMAREMQYGRDLPEGEGLELTETGFRLMSGEECSEFSVSEQKLAATRKALQSAPKCWR